MTARNEKPSPHESSTDTIIGALEITANILESVTDIDGNQSMTIEVMAIREAAGRLDKLETELINCRNKALGDAAFVCQEIMHNGFNNSAVNAAHECTFAVLRLKEATK